MSTTPLPESLPRRIARFLPSGRAWWLVAGAFVAGLLLFALVLSKRSDEFEFYRAEPGENVADAEGPAFEPLPEPLSVGGESASGMDTDAPRAAAPRIDQHADAPGLATGSDPVTAPAPPAAAAAATQDGTLPRPVSAPPPEYPRAALRSGASGEVLLLIEVGADGRPGKIEVVESSHHRDLDRAAVQAVRRWRFEPAMRDGVAVPATVRQAFSFDAPD